MQTVRVRRHGYRAEGRIILNGNIGIPVPHRPSMTAGCDEWPSVGSRQDSWPSAGVYLKPHAHFVACSGQ